MILEFYAEFPSDKVILIPIVRGDLSDQQQSFVVTRTLLSSSTTLRFLK